LNILKGKKFLSILFPFYREVEWLFNTREGRLQLAESANCQRLVVVHLQRDQTYVSMEQIKEELSGYTMELAPSDLPPNSQVCFKILLKIKPIESVFAMSMNILHFTQVPFLSLGAEGGDVGLRQERCRGKSQMSGEFVVEDVSVNGEIYRRLVFFNNPKLIQSESRIVVSGEPPVCDEGSLKELKKALMKESLICIT